MATYQIKFNRTSYHIDGIAGATCLATTRNARRMRDGRTYENLKWALEDAEKTARNQGAKVCAKCRADAETVLFPETGTSSKGNEKMSIPEPLDVENTHIGTDLISPDGRRWWVNDVDGDARGDFLWLMTAGAKRRRRLYQSDVAGWSLAK